MGFTHRGKKLEDFDDFKDEIPVSSEDENDDDDNTKGKLNDEMVMNMNFGKGGKRFQQEEEEDKKKSRKEVFEEIIAKSKMYKMAQYEIKSAAKELST
jgi:nucleolar protein 14